VFLQRRGAFKGMIRILLAKDLRRACEIRLPCSFKLLVPLCMTARSGWRLAANLTVAPRKIRFRQIVDED